MNGMHWTRWGVMGILVMGMTLWNAAIPSALAQVEITPEIRAACEQFEPGLREIALDVIVSEIVANPDGPEAKGVESAAVAIHEAHQTVADLPVSDQATLEATLTQNGVDPAAAQALAAGAQKTLTEMKAAFSGGDPVKADALAKAFQAECQTRGVDPSVFGTGRGETGGMTFDSILGGRDVTDVALKVHFETAVQEALRGVGPEGAGVAAQMREVMASMVASGVNPSEVMRGGTGEVATPPKEVLDAMSSTDRAMFEAWKSGDTATMEAAYRESAMHAGMEHGMSPESIQREFGQMEFYREMESHMTVADKEAMMKEGMDPRAETSGHSETTTTTSSTDYEDGHGVCPEGTVHQEGVAQGPGHCL